MVYFNILNMILIIFGMLVCGKYKNLTIKKLWPEKRAAGIRFGFALFLWDIYIRVFSKGQTEQKRAQKFRTQMTKLFPLEKIEETEIRCCIYKIRNFLYLWIAVNGLAIAASLSMTYGHEIFKEGKLLRPEPGAEEAIIHMEAENQTAGKQEVEIKVSPRVYEGKEREELFKRAENYIRSHALGENDDWGSIRKKLNLMTSIHEMGISVEWTIDDYNFLDDNGNIAWENLSDNGEDTSVKASMNYAGDIRSFTIDMRLYPPFVSEKEQFLEAISDVLKQCDEKSLTEEFMALPSEIDGEKITWSEVRKNIPEKITGAGLLILIVSAAYKTGERKEMLRKRSEQLLKDYPEFVYKLVLLNGAGMEMKASLTMMVKEAESGNRLERYLWQEAKVMLMSMEQGVSEVRAYEMFGQRCGELPYLKLSTLMIQSLKKGVGGMRVMMADTADEAVMMKREQARKAGELVETKLLMPMGLMLLIVLIILVVPAFMTMNL